MKRQPLRIVRLGRLAAVLLFMQCMPAALAAPPPPVVPDEVPARIEVLQPGVKLTLLAQHPDLVTPTGIDIDAQGSIWLVACHTHFRPLDYAGPEHDEILVFDRDGKNRRVFYNKTDATMQVKLGPEGWVYLAERDRILRVKDTDGDGRPDLDYRLFEAALAASNTLRGKPAAGITDVDALVERVTNAATPARLKGYALRLAPATHPKITTSLLRELLAANDPLLSLEVVRTLAARNANDAREILAEIAADEARAPELRAEAIVGLASSAKPEHHRLLLTLATHDNSNNHDAAIRDNNIPAAAIRDEALRALRSSPLDAAQRKSLSDLAQRHPATAVMVNALLEPASINANRPGVDDTAAWLKRLAALPGAANAEAGRRIFFHPRVALCATCHRHDGRGNVVGPEMSLVARQGDRLAILRSILEPSRDIAPQYYHTVLQLKDGTTFSGILLRSSSVDVFRDITGKERAFQTDDIEQRAESKISLMPAGVVSALTDGELRDLLAFLTNEAPSR